MPLVIDCVLIDCVDLDAMTAFWCQGVSTLYMYGPDLLGDTSWPR